MKTLAFIIATTLLTSCGINGVTPNSTIQGSVMISPLCGNVPSEQHIGTNPCGFSDETLDKIYGNYRIVLKSNDNAMVSQKKLDHTSRFSFTVDEGNYSIMVESDVPNAFKFTDPLQLKQSFFIKNGENKYFQFNVNTGIQ